MKNKIAFFDFDGTLTKKDSLTEFYKYVYEDTFVFNYHLRNILTYLLVRLGILNYLSLKMKRLRFLVRKVPKPMLNEKSAVFFEKFMKNEWKKEGEKEIMQLKEKGFDIVIVSASVDLLLLNLQDNMDVKIITNQLEILDENYTGRFLNEKDCNFDEKVHRIKREYNLEDYDKIYAYGDSKGDFAMFELAHKSFLNPFKE